MRIHALQKTTTLDFPGKVSAIVFTPGCNFHCPYCHNPELVHPGSNIPLLDEEEVLHFLQKRKNVLEGLVITGGEPTLQNNLPGFCARVKSLGYAIKLDTNGSLPHVLEHLLHEQLADYVALDLKAAPAAYAPHICAADMQAALLRSLELLHQSPLPHEFRITAAAPMVNEKAFSTILEITHKAPLFLQPLRLENVLDSGFFSAGPGRALEKQEMEALCAMALARGRHCEIR